MSTDLRLPGLPADDPRSIPADTPDNPTANALPTPEHGGSLGGTTGYISLEEGNEGSARTGGNNPADRSKFFAPGADADDPRAPSEDGPATTVKPPESSPPAAQEPAVEENRKTTAKEAAPILIGGLPVPLAKALAEEFEALNHAALAEIVCQGDSATGDDRVRSEGNRQSRGPGPNPEKSVRIDGQVRG